MADKGDRTPLLRPASRGLWHTITLKRHIVAIMTFFGL